MKPKALLPSSPLLLFVGVVASFIHAKDINTQPQNNNYGECSSSDSTESKEGTCTVKQQEPQCKYYLAQSSIPNAGFGVYTTQAIKKDEDLMESSDAPSVLVYDGDYHYPTNRLWSMANYFWSGEGSAQFECTSVEEYVVNFGTSCNFHTYLKNVLPEEVEYYDALNPRSDGSPGIGAYSYHGGAKFTASRDIDAGEELFADYGEEWLDDREYLGDIPRENDFQKAGEIIMKMIHGVKDDDINGKNSRM